jgi:tungstate transport system substrate-binding protein
MKHLLFTLLAVCVSSHPVVAGDNAPRPPIRVAVIGGMTLSGMWQELSAQFEKDTGWHVETVVTGPKAVLAENFKKGGSDLLTMHASDEAANLVADGFGINMRPWARNEHCIMGPPSDPAGIRGMNDGAAALKKIAEAKAPFVDFMGPGSREVSHRLWTAAGVQPKGDWVLKDESSVPQEIVAFAASKNAYVIVGRIPILKGKIPSSNMEVMVKGDPAMRRPYVVMEANPKKFPNINVEGAKALSAWHTGESGRSFLQKFAEKQADGAALFYPVEGEGAAAVK